MSKKRVSEGIFDSYDRTYGKAKADAAEDYPRYGQDSKTEWYRRACDRIDTYRLTEPVSEVAVGIYMEEYIFGMAVQGVRSGTHFIAGARQARPGYLED